MPLPCRFRSALMSGQCSDLCELPVNKRILEKRVPLNSGLPIATLLLLRESWLHGVVYGDAFRKHQGTSCR